MTYAEALEQQVRNWRWVSAPGNRAFVRKVLADATGTTQRFVADELERADPYYWTGQFCDLLNAMVNRDGWRTMPPLTLRPELLPGSAGFFWFENALGLPPMQSPELAGRPGFGPDGLVERDLSALSWTAYVDHRGREGLHLTAWCSIRADQGRVYPMHRALWPYGTTQEQAASESVGTPAVELRDDPAIYTRHVLLSYLAAAFALLDQKLLTAPQEQADRAARKRVEREGWTQQPLIRVVELRRRVHAAPGGEENDTQPVEWSCQWMVRGHWRQQYFPKSQDHRPLWILPHVKGPEDKPLKAPRATIFAVVR